MSFLRSGVIFTAALLFATAAHADRPRHKASAKGTKTSQSSGRAVGKHSRFATRKPGFSHPANMSSDRATAIQQALIQQHYMSGQPTGSWDDQTRSAMTRYQQDHGWQTKVTPDSRALISLGLGPDQTGAAPVPAATGTKSGQGSVSATPPGQQPQNSLGNAIAAQQNLVN